MRILFATDIHAPRPRANPISIHEGRDIGEGEISIINSGPASDGHLGFVDIGEPVVERPPVTRTSRRLDGFPEFAA